MLMLWCFDNVQTSVLFIHLPLPYRTPTTSTANPSHRYDTTHALPTITLTQPKNSVSKAFKSFELANHTSSQPAYDTRPLSTVPSKLAYEIAASEC